MLRSFLALALLIAPLCLSAQGVTTSVLKGTVRDANGGIRGAVVTAVHVPSGTDYSAVTSEKGKFSIPNMRAGGPYKVTIFSPGYDSLHHYEIFLKLGQPYVLNDTMTDTGEEAQHGERGEHESLNSEHLGIATHISTQQLMTMPTISRSINDMLRMVPQATSTNVGAIGGGNYRQSHFAVDGSDFNNVFGVGTNLPANGSPISLDALQEITVNVAPYDVRLSGFIGGEINAVTRSGTNQFAGSVYTFFRNQKLQGNQVAGEVPLETPDDNINTYGFRVGGPIVQDKLFLFANFETSTEVRPGQAFHASTPSEPFGSDPSTARPSESELNGIREFLFENYGYEAGPYESYDFTTENNRFTARLDWNMNSHHNLAVRYSQVKSQVPLAVNNSRSPLARFPVDRTSIFAMPFKNTSYYQEANLFSFATELNSVFAGGFSNTLRATYTHQEDPRSSDSNVFPFVDILDGSGAPFTSFGYEPFTFENLRDVKTIAVVNSLTWTREHHVWTAGFQIEHSSVVNSFKRFATSYYTFDNWNDFVNGAQPRDFALTYSMLPGFAPAFPTSKVAQYSIYGQDEIHLSDKLTVIAGLRLEMPVFIKTEEIQTHPLVAEQHFAHERHIDTGELPKSELMFSPRLSATYDVLGDRTLKFRVGSGIYSGKVPMVWIVSQPGDAGMIQFTQVVEGQSSTPGPFHPDPNYYRPATPPTPGSSVPSTVSVLDHHFGFPETWKTSLAVDKKLPWGFIGSIEAVLSKDLSALKGINPNLAEPAALNVNGYPDRRPIYPAAVTHKFLNPLTSAVPGPSNPNPSTFVHQGDPLGTQAFNPIVLANASQGFYNSIAVKLDKAIGNEFFISANYIHSSAKVQSDGSGDQLLSAWLTTPIVNDANNPEISYAGYVVPDRVTVALSYRKEYLKRLATTISLFYEGSVAGRFSYTYARDFNGDGQTNDLIYIPRSPSEISFVPLTTPAGTWSAAEQSDLFFKYVSQDKYLSKHMGSYSERNGAVFPWRSQVDIRLAQDFHMNGERNKHAFQVTLDVFNFANLLNPNWGVYKLVNASSLLVPTNASQLPNGNVVPTFQLATFANVPVTETFRNNNSTASTYMMQVGIRYTFN